MAEGVLFSFADEILKNLGNKALDEIASAWGFKTQLEKLRNTIITIKNVLQDAEEKQSESPAVRGWLERLRAAAYAADDLFDEFATFASQKELLDGNKLTKEVQVFFSRSNQIALAFSISQKIKRVREDLDAIVKDGNEFSFVVRPYEERRLARRPQRDQTHSYVDSKEVVGRDNDKNAIIDTLLGSTSHEHVSVVSIVGIGGLGKTTLAQMVYNDNEVEKHFELRLWVCVSEDFDIKEIVKKIIMSATNAETQNLEMDQLQSQLRKQVGGKKYLLVLDDVWNEDREQWLKLKALLKAGKEGSKLLVTTRSKKVANIMGPVPPHDLQLLSHDDSWALFEKMAFEPGQAQKTPTLTKLGKEIVQKCGNIPLAIRTLASLLYGKDEGKWLSFKNKSLAQVSDNGNNVMTILKLSYDHLLPPLKNCFAYCALFPKDYQLQKETLISLWMAEGFLLPADESQSLEEVGEEYFSILLHRCFFQDITKDKWGNIKGCKMHDLMHDLAQQVAGAEMKVANCGETNLEKRTRRLSFVYPLTSTRKIPRCVLDLKLLRTLLLPEQRYDGSDFSRSISHKIVSNFRCLRVLDLHRLGVKTLPSSIGKLIHLRYLNLSLTPIKALPDSITELQNLQTLNLDECYSLKRLPTDIRKLTNLRSLDVSAYLAYMPSGIGEFTLLHKLNKLMVNSRKPPALWWKHATAKLSDLRNLNNLRGALEVRIVGELKDPVFEARKANLSRKHGLIELHIELIKLFYEEDKGIEHDEAVLEGLKPHPNLKKLGINGYRGQKLPSWAVMENLCASLPNLVQINIMQCRNCQQLPAFGQLPFLKCLTLEYLESVEYMENSLCWLSESPEETLFFPSLQELQLKYMHNLKGWWKEVEKVNKDDQKQPSVPIPKQQHLSGKSFSSLLNLWIENCPNLTSMPLCPNVEKLILVDVNEHLPLLQMAASLSSEQSVATTSSSPSCGSSPKLKTLSIDRVEDLISLPDECLRHLSSLEIRDSKFQSTSRLGEVFRSLSSLRCLKFSRCDSLSSFSGGLEHLTALENLDIYWCDKLDLLSNEEVKNGMPWKAFNSLRSLSLFKVDTLVALPSGLQHLKNLRFLVILYIKELMALPARISCLKSLEYMTLCNCPKLTSLPEEFRELASLNELRIVECPGLTERCRGPSGEEWPKIRHIPLVTVQKNLLE